MSALQIAFIAFTFLAPAAVWLIARGQPDGPRARIAERALAILLVVFYLGELAVKWTDGTFTLDHALPMQLCDWALFAIVCALLWRWRMCFEVAYFWGLAGTFQALFTPTIATDLHWFRKFGFFFIHAGIVAGILHLLLTARWRPTPKALLHLFVASEGYLACALAVNALTGGNYGFLSHQPATPSMLDLFSHTQWLYVLEINLTAFVFFGVLYLPWWLIDYASAKPGRAKSDGSD